MVDFSQLRLNRYYTPGTEIHDLRSNLRERWSSIVDPYKRPVSAPAKLYSSAFTGYRTVLPFRCYPEGARQIIGDAEVTVGMRVRIGHDDWYEALMFGEFSSHYIMGSYSMEDRRTVADMNNYARLFVQSFPHLDKLVSYLLFAIPDMEDPSYMLVYDEKNPSRPPRRVSVGKYFRKLVTYHKFRFEEDEISKAAEEIYAMFVRPNYKFTLSSDVYDTYCEKSFGSCMYRDSSVRFYDEQPNVQVLRITERDSEELVGRALVWNVETIDNDGNKGEAVFVDRIYPSNEGRHISAVLDYAKEKGWEHKLRQGINGETTLGKKGLKFRAEIVDTGRYPYMDTLCLSEVDGDYLYSTGAAMRLFLGSRYYDSYEWQRTDGECPWDLDYDDDYHEYDSECDCVECFEIRREIAQEDFYVDEEGVCNCWDCILERARDAGWDV